ncbi:MAG: hypothetical protein M3441_13440 [Chloroflexota bacterium]|nr:hypothetical protein [Chloroflexota bacterium]
MNWEAVATDIEKSHSSSGIRGRWVRANTVTAILLTLASAILFSWGTLPAVLAVILAIVVPPMVEASVLKQDLPMLTTWDWVWRSLLGLFLGAIVAIVLLVGLVVATNVARSTGSAEPGDGMRLMATLFGATMGAIARAYIQWPTLKGYFPTSSPHIWCVATIWSAVLVAIGSNLDLLLGADMNLVVGFIGLLFCCVLAYLATGEALSQFQEQADQAAPAPAEATLRF